jgi:hypothetical protein
MAEEAAANDKKAIKQRIRALKKDRDAALEGKDSVALKRVRRRIHRLKRQLRRAPAPPESPPPSA